MLRLGLLAVVAGVAAAGATVANAAPPRCTADATRALVRSFVAGYGAGHVTAINRLWAPEPYFQWYSTIGQGGRVGSKAYDRASLAAYFRTRVRVHEQLVVTQLHAGYDSQRNLVNFFGKLVRSADDLPAAGPKDFKGAATCRSTGPTLIVWSM